MSYLGDAEVGEQVNIGAGTITANYDGTRKHTTTIGDGAFIGVDTMLVAPIDGRRGRQDRRRLRRHPRRARRQAGRRRPGPDPRAAGRNPTAAGEPPRMSGPDPRARHHRRPDPVQRRLLGDRDRPRHASAAAGSTSSSTRAAGARAGSSGSSSDPGRFLAVIQIGITFLGFLASAFAGGEPDRRPGDALLAGDPVLAPYAGRARAHRRDRHPDASSRSSSASSCPSRSASPMPSGSRFTVRPPDRRPRAASSARSSAFLTGDHAA